MLGRISLLLYLGGTAVGCDIPPDQCAISPEFEVIDSTDGRPLYEACVEVEPRGCGPQATLTLRPPGKCECAPSDAGVACIKADADIVGHVPDNCCIWYSVLVLKDCPLNCGDDAGVTLRVSAPGYLTREVATTALGPSNQNGNVALDRAACFSAKPSCDSPQAIGSMNRCASSQPCSDGGGLGDMIGPGRDGG